MERNNVELLFAKRIMELMEEVFGYLLYPNADFHNEEFAILRDLSSLTAELLKKEDVHDEIKRIAESSEVSENSSNIDEKFNTFKMIRNVINHFPIFQSWDEVYISKDLLEWNNSGGDQIKTYFKKEREFSYIIYINEDGNWIPHKEIKIRTPKLGKYNKIYLKDILSLEDALWTYSLIDYYLQFLGLDVVPRYLVSA